MLIDLGLTKGDQCSFLKRLLKQATGREARKGKTKPGHATKLSTDYNFLQLRSRIYMIAVNDALLNDAGPADV